MLYSLFLMLKAEKERYATEQAEAQAKMEHEMQRALNNGYRGA